MEVVTPALGRPFYRAITSLDALALIETPPAGAEGGSNSLQRWTLWDDFRTLEYLRLGGFWRRR
jgi:hypothetical protein